MRIQERERATGSGDAGFALRRVAAGAAQELVQRTTDANDSELSFKDVVRRRRAEQGAAVAAAVGRHAKRLGGEFIHRGGAALRAAAHAAVHPDAPLQRPASVPLFTAEERDVAAESRGGGSPSMSFLLAAAALGCALGSQYADTHQAGREKRQRIVSGAKRVLLAAKARLGPLVSSARVNNGESQSI